MTVNKTILLGLLQSAYERQQAYVASLTEAERATIGESNRWSVKDVFAHNAEWIAIDARDLASAKRNQTPPTYPDTDAKNAEIFEQYRTRSWNEVIALMTHSYGQMVKEIKTMSEADLVDPKRFAWHPGKPAYDPIAHDGYFHPLHHLAQLLLARGEREAADRLEEPTVRAMIALDDTRAREGRYTYNWACYFATAQDSDRALELLRQALVLNPETKQWSKEDSEMTSLRENPDFKALVGQ